MTKKRKKPHKRRAKRRDRYGSPDGIPPSLRRLPVIWGPKNCKKAYSYLGSFIAYEDWIRSGRPEIDIDVAQLFPPEYEQVYIQCPQGFEFYRHSLVTYLERTLHLSPCHSYISSLIRRIEQHDPQGHAVLLEDLSAEDVRANYTRQLRNSVMSLLDARKSNSNSSESNIKAALRAYCEFYEIDFPLLFIGILAKSERTGQIKPGAFGGLNSKTKKGALVKQILDELAGSPLEEIVENAYVPDLRNAVSHNKYEMVSNDNAVITGVRSTITGKEWTVEELNRIIRSANVLTNSVQAVAAHGWHLRDALTSEKFSRFGIMNRLTFAIPDTPFLTIFVFQLWCFYNLDTLGAWVDAAKMTAEVDGNENTMRLLLGDTVICSVPKTPEMVNAWSRDWVEIVRIPIGPDVGLAYPRYEYENQQFEVLGVPDRHFVPFQTKV